MRLPTFSRQGLLLVSGLMALLLTCSAGHAAPPDAGTLLQTIKPAPAPPRQDTGALPEQPVRPAIKLDATLRFVVKAIRITGAKALDETTLQRLVADAIGKELTLADLQKYAGRITRRYHEAGYPLARAYLPAQEIRDGMVEIAILEGRLAKLNVQNDSRLTDAQVAARLSTLKEGEAINGGTLERSLLLLDDLPGVDVKSTLKPGASVGTTDLDVRVAARSPYSAALSLDNYGNRSTGDLRLGANATAGNLARLGDTLSVNTVAANDLAYGRLAWQTPVGSQGTQLGAAWAGMRYRLGEEFAKLDAHGTAGIGSLYLLHPFVRSRATNISAQVDYDHKELEDDVDATGTVSKKRLDLGAFGLSGDHTDGLGGGGRTNWSATWTTGRLGLDPASQRIDDAGHQTEGGYDKFSGSLGRQQNLPRGFLLDARLQAQAACQNLDSSEKMTLGGSQGVRAYPEGEAPSDDAWLANLELRHGFLTNWQATLFYDAAQGRLNHKSIAGDGDDEERLSGTGLGLAYNRPDGLSLQLGVAWRTGPQPTSDTDRTPRVWAQAVKRF
jgi:hemolysin activation/secretion protein